MDALQCIGQGDRPFEGNCQPGPFPDCNWHDANSLETALDYAVNTGDKRQWILDAATQADCWFTNGGDPWNTGPPVVCGDCTFGYNDDALWWALAFIRAFDVTGESHYLSDAATIFSGVCPWWGSFLTGSLCGHGGVPWQRSKKSQLPTGDEHHKRQSVRSQPEPVPHAARARVRRMWADSDGDGRRPSRGVGGQV